MTRTLAVSAAVFALAIVGGVLHYTHADPVATFVVCGAALGGVAWAIGIATESVGARFGPAVTGVLQSTLGNLPELFIVLFALSAGELVVAQFSILGSLFANALLVLGLAISAGSTRQPDGAMPFGARLPNDTATLLLLAVFLIVLLGLSDQVGDRASAPPGRDLRRRGDLPADRVRRLARRLPALGRDRGGVARTSRAHAVAPVPPRHRPPRARRRGGGARLGAGSSTRSTPPSRRSDLEGVHGARDRRHRGQRGRERRRRQLARKGHNDLAISVVKNSVAQIAASSSRPRARVAPLRRPLTFVVEPIYLGALALTAIALWQITGDGEAYLFEGLALISLYVVLATLVWFE